MDYTLSSGTHQKILFIIVEFIIEGEEEAQEGQACNG